MNKPPLYVFGEVLFDCFPDDEPVLGGAPFNVAWHLQALGEQPQLISAVGKDDLGRKIRAAMTDWGMSTDYLQVDPEHPTGQVTVTFENGEPVYEIKEHCAYDHIRSERLPVLDETALIYHGSLAMRNSISANTLSTLTRDRHHRIFIDVNLRSPWWKSEHVIESLNYAYCVKLSQEELRLLAEMPGDSTDPEHSGAWLETAGQFKLSHNIVNLLITWGARGAILLDAEGELISAEAEPLDMEVVDTVGAGDAFAAVIILGMLNEWNWQTALERAQQFAGIIVTRRGAVCTDAAVYQDFRRLWGIIQ